MAEGKDALCGEGLKMRPRAIIRVALPHSRDGSSPGEAWIEDENGKILMSPVPVLGTGTGTRRNSRRHDNRYLEDSDTPTGIYNVTGSRPSNKTRTELHSYGPNERLILEGSVGEIRDVMDYGTRPDVLDPGLLRGHGGDPNADGNLRPTLGCLRFYNADQRKLLETLKGGPQPYLKDGKSSDVVLTVDDIEYCPTNSDGLSQPYTDLYSPDWFVKYTESLDGANQELDYTPLGSAAVCAPKTNYRLEDLAKGIPNATSDPIIQCSSTESRLSDDFARVSEEEQEFKLPEYSQSLQVGPDVRLTPSDDLLLSASDERLDSYDLSRPDVKDAELPELVPLLDNEEDRRASIINNTPGVIRIGTNEAIQANPYPWYCSQGEEEVTLNMPTIQNAASHYRVDLDFVSAVMWLETTHGWYDGPFNYIGVNKSIRPMNINAEPWKGFGISRAELGDPKKNIDVGVRILSAIWDRTESPTYEKVATLYNNLSATKVNVYGKTVEYYRSQKPWANRPWAPKIGVR